MFSGSTLRLARSADAGESNSPASAPQGDSRAFGFLKSLQAGHSCSRLSSAVRSRSRNERVPRNMDTLSRRRAPRHISRRRNDHQRFEPFQPPSLDFRSRGRSVPLKSAVFGSLWHTAQLPKGFPPTPRKFRCMRRAVATEPTALALLAPRDRLRSPRMRRVLRIVRTALIGGGLSAPLRIERCLLATPSSRAYTPARGVRHSEA